MDMPTGYAWCGYLLDPVVGGVGHIDVAGGVDGHAVGAVESAVGPGHGVDVTGQRRFRDDLVFECRAVHRGRDYRSGALVEASKLR